MADRDRMRDEEFADANDEEIIGRADEEDDEQFEEADDTDEDDEDEKEGV